MTNSNYSVKLNNYQEYTRKSSQSSNTLKKEIDSSIFNKAIEEIKKHTKSSNLADEKKRSILDKVLEQKNKHTEILNSVKDGVEKRIIMDEMIKLIKEPIKPSAPKTLE